MERQIITTSDGSTTIFLPEWEESYHSKHGAVQEAKHVFIKNGLSLFKGTSVAVLEIGFGTGLNAFITFLESKTEQQKINYVGVEAYPISALEVVKMNYPLALEALEDKIVFDAIHASDWEVPIEISSEFTLTKRKQLFENISDEGVFDLIYFDAFGFRVQPDLWSLSIFQKMYTALKSGGVLVTYACRSPIKTAMIEAGFTIEKLAGPPGKREMLRATKK